jgi:RNA polymerase sigma-70 factor, ECF subfamily
MVPPADEAAKVFTEIFEEHHAAVHAYLVGRVGEPELARDLLQETFLRVWRRLDDLRELPPPRRLAWIFTAARNLVTDTYRARATREATTQAWGALALDIAPPADQPDARAERNELVIEVGAAVRTLSEELRVILAMHAVGELTSAQIGAALGQPAGTVRYKLALARRAVAAALRTTHASVAER